jgi:hypothetical protein
MEEAERGEVLPICLAEIDRSRPYFIGMLGERYGWIPPHEGYASDLLERQPWLKKHQGGKSVTELEILHGVLKNKRMKTRAFFYFRSPAYARFKGGHYVPDTTEDRQRQLDLKRRIKGGGYTVTVYRDPEALAKRMERDLWKLLDAEFPATDVPNAFEREAMRHEAYAVPRRRLYLGAERYEAALGQALESGQQRILIEGASGGGKSALLANFFEGYRKRHPKHHVHEHYLGASTDAADPHALVRRLIEFIQRATGSTEEIPGDPQKLMDSLPIWLATASVWARKRRTWFIVVLDSLNSLTEQQDLRWWPAYLPQGVHIVTSCLTGAVLQALKAKAQGLEGQNPRWKVIPVKPLTKTERKNLLNTYLALFNKTLPKELTAHVMAHPLSGNPLFIRTLAEELRLFGVHEELAKRLAHYLKSETVDDLFEKVIERVEEDCGKKTVKATLTAIWASRAGLTEKEILGIAELTPAAWATIHHALEEGISQIGGRFTFSHDYLFGGAQKRFGLTGLRALSIHKLLLQYFDNLVSEHAALDVLWHSGQLEVWKLVLSSLRTVTLRKKELTEQSFFRWDGNYLAVLNRASSIGNMLLREPRCHLTDACFSRSGGAHDDYTTYWRFPCCGKDVASEYGVPSKFREDGCMFVPRTTRGVLFQRLPNASIPYWDLNDLRTALEASILPRACSEDRFTRAYLHELRRATKAADHLSTSNDWTALQTARDFYASRKQLELRLGTGQAVDACSERIKILEGRLHELLTTQ